tara:strand:+ start:837 stop:2312 length:1476 start_codon:yes stop_codon:yes gene_type:complete
MGMSGGGSKGGGFNTGQFGGFDPYASMPVGPVGGRTGSGKINTGYGGFSNIRQMPPRPSLQQQYSGLNQGVQGFQPLGIRGYTPPAFSMPAQPFNPFGYGSFGGNPFLRQPQLPQIPFNPPVVEPPPVFESLPYFPEMEIGGGGFNFDNFDFLERYNREAEDFNEPVPQFVKQVVEGGADRFVPQTPFEIQEPIPNIEALQQIAIPQIPLAQEPVSLAEPIVPLAIDQGLQDRALETQLALETATGPRTQGQFQEAKNAATAANLQKAFAESGGKTLAQEQAEAANAAARAQSLANRPTAVTDTLATQPVQQFGQSLAPTLNRPSMANIGGLAAKSGGGLVKGFAEGGMPMAEENQTGERLEEETIMALMGKHPNPKQVFNKYLEVYGEEGLMALAAEVEQMMSSQGRMIDGPGGGVDDFVPAMIDGVQPAALSKDEYVIPADVVAHAGDGSSEAGGKKFDQLVSRVRKSKTGNTTQPEQIEFEEEITQVT